MKHIMKVGTGAFSNIIKNKFGTVWTDQTVVNLTIDEAFKVYNDNLNTATICDPACGDGNFLITIYNLLTKLSNITDPTIRSINILNRIYGVDIINRMVAATRCRLLLEHFKHTNSADSIKIINQILNNHIIHGNTLRSENDTWTLETYEGGLCPKWFQDKQFNIIVINPPYTQYKNSNGKNLPVPIKYNQPNMALSFWDWCHNHTMPNGIYSMNVIDMVLNGKLGTLRKSLAPYITSVIYNDLTRRYSVGFGGSLTTLIMTCSHKHLPQYYNNIRLTPDEVSTLISGRFISNMFNQSTMNHNLKLIKLNKVSEFIGRAVGAGRNATITWNDHIEFGRSIAIDGHYVAFCYMLSQKIGRHDQFKYCTINPKILASHANIGTAGHSHINYIKFSTHEQAKLIWCFLNSSYSIWHSIPLVAVSRVPASQTSYIGLKVGVGDTRNILVPDWNYYLTTKPKELFAVIDFADNNITNDSIATYSNGVDTVINNLLFDDSTLPQPEKVVYHPSSFTHNHIESRCSS